MTNELRRPRTAQEAMFLGPEDCTGSPLPGQDSPAAARRDAGDIYKAATKCCAWRHCVDSFASAEDVLVVEHILRAMLEVLTPEQRASILAKVSL
ncbi:MAG: hypothetical protein V4593_08070 [Pseudomonadota bacterium]